MNDDHHHHQPLDPHTPSYMDAFAPIEIIMTHPPTHPMPPGVIVQVREDFDPDLDMDVVDGIPCTTVERTIVDLGEYMSVDDLVEMIDISAHRGILDVHKLVNVIGRVNHQRAKHTAAEALRRWQAGEDLR